MYSNILKYFSLCKKTLQEYQIFTRYMHFVFGNVRKTVKFVIRIIYERKLHLQTKSAYLILEFFEKIFLIFMILYLNIFLFDIKIKIFL